MNTPTVPQPEDPQEKAGEPQKVSLHEEILEPVTRETELGQVRIHKRVETVPVQAEGEVSRDEISVERVPIDRQVETPPPVRQEGDTLIIPVVEEVLVVEKRLIVREEIRVTRRRVSERVPVQETVRREVVDIEMPETAGGAEGAGE